jgi:hypothetical protein
MVTDFTTTKDRPVYDILTEADSYPYEPPVSIGGIAIVNDNTDDVTVVISTDSKDITLNCTQYGRVYSATFDKINSINVTAGTTYQIELRRL